MRIKAAAVTTCGGAFKLLEEDSLKGADQLLEASGAKADHI